MNQQLQALINEESCIENSNEILQLRKQIEALTEQKKNLGIFDRKEKKALQEQIDTIKGEVNHMLEKEKAVIEDKIALLKKKVDEIDKELSMDR